MPRFNNADERAAWTLAESLAERAGSMMTQAEKALETWRTGKELNRIRCARRGISASDAEIRWAETASAKNALSDNSFHVSLATMYFGAAAAHYSRAQYLRSHGDSGAEPPVIRPRPALKQTR
jgi:hypothetical protein